MLDYEFTENTPTDATPTDYDSVYDAVYDALTDYSADISSSNRSIIETSATDSDMIEFSSSTDATMYTVSAEPLTCAQQSAVYLLEIRNLLLIFILGYFILNLFYRFKNSIFSFTR